MNSCLTRYGPVQDDLEDHHQDDIRVLDEVPEHRSIKIRGLVTNTSYRLIMSCTDIYGSLHNSSVLNFTTGPWIICSKKHLQLKSERIYCRSLKNFILSFKVKILLLFLRELIMNENLYKDIFDPSWIWIICRSEADNKIETEGNVKIGLTKIKYRQ